MNSEVNLLELYSDINKPPLISNKYSGLKVTALQADSSACGHYRIIHPLHYLNMHGADCKWIQIASLDLLMDSDIVIAQRQYDKSVLENMLLEAKKYGKGGTYNTKILTPTGWTTFKDVKVGDKVIGSDGKSCQVIGRYERGILPTYKVTFSDNSSVLCDENHLWEVTRRSQRATHNKKEIISTKDLLNSNIKLKSGYNFQIPLVKPVEFDSNIKLPIDPYLLGVLLGDGCISSRNFYISSDNTEIIDEIKKVIPSDWNLEIHPDRQYYRISVKGSKTRNNPARVSLKELGLIGTNSSSKFIPEIYLLASPKDRLSLIQGLMDTDGTVDKNGRLGFTTISMKLVEGFSYLVQSLGGTVRVYTRKQYNCILPNGKERINKESYNVVPFLPSNMNLFRFKQPRNIFNRKEPTRAIKSIEYVGKENIVCIAVDSVDNLYATDNFIITHNCVIYEVDDNLHSVLPGSPVYGIYHQGTEQLKNVGKILNNCDGATVSTEELAGDYYCLNNNIEVLQNSIDFDIRDWKTEPEDRDSNYLIVGWSGGTTHLPDLQLIEPQIKNMLKKYPHVKFGIYTSEQLMKIVVDSWGLDPERILFIPPRSFHNYPGGLAYFDISLVPVVNCRFNASKSNLKTLEFGSWKIPSICSKLPPYCTTIKHGVNGMIGITDENISYLIENESKRKEMGQRMYEVVKSDFDMAKNCHLWPQAWNRIMERSNEKKPGKFWPVLWGNVGRNDLCPCGSGQKYKKCSNGCYGSWGN